MGCSWHSSCRLKTTNDGGFFYSPQTNAQNRTPSLSCLESLAALGSERDGVRNGNSRVARVFEIITSQILWLQAVSNPGIKVRDIHGNGHGRIMNREVLFCTRSRVSRRCIRMHWSTESTYARFSIKILSPAVLCRYRDVNARHSIHDAVQTDRPYPLCLDTSSSNAKALHSTFHCCAALPAAAARPWILAKEAGSIG